MFTLRRLTKNDIDQICHHRENMFRDAGRSDEILTAMSVPFRAWLKPRLDNGSYFGFLAEWNGDVVGGIGMMVIDWPPHPLHPMDARRGYILNLYVEEERRERGIARALMDECEGECRRLGLHYAILHPTQVAKPIYEQLGWTETNEMAKRL
jgi:GNAT superfamily N-acetyltransferase